jgi:hypothetical protein
LTAEIDLALRKPRSAEEHEQTLRRLAVDSQQLIDLAETLLALGALGSTALPPATSRSPMRWRPRRAAPAASSRPIHRAASSSDHRRA